MSWDYQASILGVTFIECSGILVGLRHAKLSKPYDMTHLCVGAFLILWGVFSLLVLDSDRTLITVWASKNYISANQLSDAISRLDILKYVIPAISIAFGTRFVGNWITAEKPVKQEPQT